NVIAWGGLAVLVAGDAGVGGRTGRHVESSWIVRVGTKEVAASVSTEDIVGVEHEVAEAAVDVDVVDYIIPDANSVVGGSETVAGTDINGVKRHARAVKVRLKIHYGVVDDPHGVDVAGG